MMYWRASKELVLTFTRYKPGISAEEPKKAMTNAMKNNDLKLRDVRYNSS